MKPGFPSLVARLGLLALGILLPAFFLWRANIKPPTSPADHQMGRPPVRPASVRGSTTPLHHAAAQGDIVRLAALVEDANLEVRNEHGFTPLHLAVQQGHLAAAALLLDKGADIHARDLDGNTVLHQIVLHRPGRIQSRPPETWLARHGSDPSKQPYVRYLMTRDKYAMEWPVPNAAAFLLMAGAEAAATNYAGHTVAHLATEELSRLFDEERAGLLKLLGATPVRALDARDARGDTALHRAARGHFREEVAELITAGADVNATNRQGRTPLHAAVERLNIWEGPLAEILKAHPDVNARDHAGLTPLMVLAMSPSGFLAEATRALLNAGADPTIRDHRGRTVVHLLLSSRMPDGGMAGALAAVVAAGADLTRADDQGRTPLHYLAAVGSGPFSLGGLGIFQLFEAAPVDLSVPDQQGDTPLHVAARKPTSQVFDWLVNRGAPLDVPNRAGETPRALAARSLARDGFHRPSAQTDVFQAAAEGNVEALTALLQADPALLEHTNRFGETPLRVAVRSGRTNAVAFLEARGARWDIASAVWAGRADLVDELLARQPGTIRSRPGLLHLAARQGHTEVTRRLLRAGADWRVADSLGLSPLGLARLQNHPETAAVLLESGAQLNLFDAVRLGDVPTVARRIQEYRSVMHATNQVGFHVAETAAAAGQERALELLLDRGVPVTYTNARDGVTLLHTAVLYGQSNTTALLLRRGASVNARDQAGWTPLHLAAQSQQPDLVELLLRAGAAVNATNALGLTPWDLARRPRPPETQLYHAQVLLGPDRVAYPRRGVTEGARGEKPTLPTGTSQRVVELLEAAGGRSGHAVTATASPAP